MLIEDALARVVLLERTESCVDVRGVQYDSRRVRAGDVFVAMRGGSTDGNRFVDAAIGTGCGRDRHGLARSVWERRGDVPTYLVENGRRALAGIAANLLDHPERKLKVSAVTGTNGKTTTAFLLEQMLRSVGRKCVLIGTIETHIGDEVRPSEHTTPEASDLLQIFADGVAAGCTEVVMEMSSHALDQERVWGIPVDVAIFTNLTQDHLDYHGTMEAYFQAKLKLFEGVGAPPPRVSVINDDDPRSISIQRVCRDMQQGRPGENGFGKYTYGVGESSLVRASDVSLELGWTSFFLSIWEKGNKVRIPVSSPLSGKVNVYNVLAASCAALGRGLTLDQITKVVAKLDQVPGRFQTVPNDVGITVVVDYAHTDDALRNLIALARELVGKGRVITLFGCGGDRDRTKRPKMGRAAGEGSDLVVLTSDNPRTEDPLAILDEALAGVLETDAEYVVEPDRAKAIALAIGAAKVGDIVLLAGKGHEKVQILRDGTVPFDDVAVAAGVLAAL